MTTHYWAGGPAACPPGWPHAPSQTVTVTAGKVTINGQPPVFTSSPWALCPDLLRWEQIGQADRLRGRVVRGFFWVMRVWKP